MLGDFMPCLAMVLLQVGYAGMNISSKLALESGMNAFVLVAYRQIFSFFAIAPFAFFMERKTRPKITMSILFQIFLCSLTGAVGNQVFYFIGLEYTTPTTASALNNALPAVTFVLAALFRLEAVGIKTVAGQAKVIGTIVCVGGSMLLSFYHGHIIAISESDIHWKYAENMNGSSSSSSSNLLGPFLVMLSCAAWAAWFIIQARLGEKFSAPYTTTALMSLMASVECVAIALIPEHTVAAWSLKSSVRVIAAIYAGVVCSALAFCLMSWCIERKGPLYVSMFSPLMLVIVAVLSWALLHEKLFVGTLVGSILIIAGLYAVLWGKGKEETKEMKSIEENVDAKRGDDDDEKDDLEAGKHDNSGDMIGKKIDSSPR